MIDLEPKRTCKLCGCDDEHACKKDNGKPCSWLTSDLCDNCVVVLEEGQLLVPKECRHCSHLVEDKEIEKVGYKNYWRCEQGRFDDRMPDGDYISSSYALSGINRPNKSVAKAQMKCPSFEVHPRWLKNKGAKTL
jgi:hypothetical protein